MPVKCTLQFTAGRSTWSEAHYSRVFTDPNSEGISDAAIRLANARVGLLGNGVALTRVRLSKTETARVVKNLDLNGLKVVQPIPAQDQQLEDADIPNVSAIARADDGAGHAKNIYLAGVPDGAVAIASLSPLYWEWTGSFVKAWNTYIRVLEAEWNFRVQAPVAPATQVQAVSPTQLPLPGVFLTTLTKIVGSPNEAPFSVHLSGFRRIGTRSPNLSGIYDVVAVANPAGPPNVWEYTLGETGNVSNSNFLKYGTIAMVAYSYVPYVNIVISKSGTRKRGGSQGAPRGRSRTRS